MEVRILKNSYSYSEVLDIIDNMEVKYKEMLPRKLMDFLNENKDLEYQKHVNPQIPLSEQNISKDAITILAMINLKYWVKDEKHKADLIEKYKANNKEISSEELKKILESSDNNDTIMNKSQSADVNTSLVVKRCGFIERIKNCFLKRWNVVIIFLEDWHFAGYLIADQQKKNHLIQHCLRGGQMLLQNCQNRKDYY